MVKNILCSDIFLITVGPKDKNVIVNYCKYDKIELFY